MGQAANMFKGYDVGLRRLPKYLGKSLRSLVEHPRSEFAMVFPPSYLDHTSFFPSEIRRNDARWSVSNHPGTARIDCGNFGLRQIHLPQLLSETEVPTNAWFG